MKRYSRGNLWWSLAGWTAGAAALAGAALAATASPTTIALVALFAALMLLVQLRWQAAARRAVEERERTLALLQETLDTTAEGFLLLDLDGRVVSYNRKLMEMSGLPAEAFDESNFDALLAWLLERVVDPTAFLATLEQFQERLDFELRDELRLLDGRIFERYTRPHRVGGRIVGRIWSFREITSERNALESLCRREQQLAQAQHIAGLGSFDWDIAADEVHASDELWRIAGYEPEAFPWTFARYLECVHPDDRAGLLELVKAALTEGGPLRCDVRVVHPDGSLHYSAVSGQAVLDASGAPAHLIGTVQNVTDRWTAAAALERSIRVEQTITQVSKQLGKPGAVDTGAILRVMGEGLGADRVYLLQSKRDGLRVAIERVEEWCAPGLSAELDGMAGRAFEADSWAMWQVDEHGGLAIPRVEELPDEAAPMRGWLAGRGVAAAAIVPIRELRQGLRGLIGLDFNSGQHTPSEEDLRALRTVGEMLAAHFARDRAERETAQLEEDLRRANRIEAIGHLAAGIAHEINTPIQYVGDNLRFLDESFAGMKGAMEAYAQLLVEARGVVSPERIAAVATALERADVEYLMQEAPRASAQALDGVQRVAEIVRAMKEFSHPGAGIKVPTDLNQAIRSTVTVARNEWKYVAELVTELDEELPPVPCLPGELNQAILNLVINAAHAIADRQQAEGTEVPGTITISTARAANAVIIRVRDTGTGIPPEIQPRIFDPFFTTKEVGRGTGQGLTFVHTIVVDKHGGTITFETEPGVGTSFVVRIPNVSDEPGLEVAA